MQLTLNICQRALRSMQCEIGRYPTVETGGILLGYVSETELKIVEAIDGGYKKVIREAGRFRYDIEYVEHLCEIISTLYSPPLELVGVWHKHNHSDSPMFSYEDCNIHHELLSITQHKICSILFQKQPNNLSEYAMHTYIVSGASICNEIVAEII